jgi:hypothetical protein
MHLHGRYVAEEVLGSLYNNKFHYCVTVFASAYYFAFWVGIAQSV